MAGLDASLNVKLKGLAEAEAFLLSLRSGSDKSMDKAFRDMVLAWVPASMALVTASFISDPLPWSARLGSLFNGCWTDRVLRSRLATGASKEASVVLRRVAMGSLAENLGHLELASQCFGEWSVRLEPLGWDALQSKLRRGSVAPATTIHDQWTWSMTAGHLRLDDRTWKLLAYTPTSGRQRWWLQYAILLGLPGSWDEPYRSMVQWLLHALLPGFSHSALVDLWPWVVRCWMTGLGKLLAVSPVPIPTLLPDHILWQYRGKAREHFAPYVGCTLDWISKRVCDTYLAPKSNWTLSPCWFHPVALALLRSLHLYHATPPTFVTATQAIEYALQVVVAITALGVLARHPTADQSFGSFQAWLRRLRVQVWQRLESPLRQRWQQEFSRRFAQNALLLQVQAKPLQHVLAVL